MSVIRKDPEYAELVEDLAAHLASKLSHVPWSQQREEVKAVFRDDADGVLAFLAARAVAPETERLAS